MTKELTMEKTSLPIGWELKTLSELTSKLGDGLHGTPKYTENGEYYFINGNNLNRGKIVYKERTKRVSKIEFDKYKKPLNDRTIFVSINGTLGNVAFYNNEKIILGKSACYFNLLENVDKYYIKYLIQSPYFIEYAHKEATGATIKNVSLKTMRTFEVPLPKSLPQQKQIVAILDKAFAAIATAKANAAQNLQNAAALFESYLQNVFENKDDGWEEKSLGEVCKIIGGGTPSKKREDFYTGNILWATVRDMKSEIIKNTQHKITTDAVKNSSTNIIPKGNVIIATRVGLGKVCLLDKDSAINQDLKAVIPKKDTMLSIPFLFRWFTSISEKIINEGTGATVQGVKLTFINSLTISLPSIDEQKQIVKKLDALSAETKNLEALYTQKIADLEELKKSVLQKAFSGQLNTNS